MCNVSSLVYTIFSIIFEQCVCVLYIIIYFVSGVCLMLEIVLNFELIVYLCSLDIDINIVVVFFF